MGLDIKRETEKTIIIPAPRTEPVKEPEPVKVPAA